MVESVKACTGTHKAHSAVKAHKPAEDTQASVFSNASPQEKAKKNYEDYIQNGKLKCSPETKVLGVQVKEASCTYTPGIKDTFGSLKKALNLPDGTFKKQLDQYPGNRDQYKVTDPVDIPADVLQKSVGIK